MKYDFDKVIDRYNTNSLKYDYKIQRGMPNDVIPLWVADMDFQTAPEIIDALVEKSKHGIFGYSEPLDSYFVALKSWLTKHHGWTPTDNKFLLTPGVVFGICAIINALTNVGDAVIINQPVYYPFFESIKDNDRKLVVSELVNNNGKYEIDFNDFEQKIKDNDVKLYILCSPHNPVGRVWKKDELEKIDEITKKYNVFVIADEIHADFIYPGNKFISYASIDTDFSHSIICTSPSKTFNLAGLQLSNLYIKNDTIRRKVRHTINSFGYSQVNIMGIVSCEVAYTKGEAWYNELLKYLKSNLDYLKEFISTKLNKVKVIEPEGTYLIWLDFNGLNLSDKELNDIIVNKAKLWLDSGNIFGKAGYGYERINIACPRKTLELALNNLYNAFKD